MRAAFLANFAVCVLSVTLTQPLSNLTVTEGEEFIIEPSSYFSGCALTFQVSSSPGFQLSVFDPSSLSLIATFPHSHPNPSPTTFKLLTFPEEEYLLSGKGSVLSAFKVSKVEESLLLWEMEIQGNGEIRKIELLPTMSNVVLLLHIEESDGRSKIMQLTFLDIEILSVGSQEIVHLPEISELTDIDFIVFTHHYGYESLVFAGKAEKSAQRDTLLIYSLNADSEPRLKQRVSQLDLATVGSSLSIVKLLKDAVMVYVLDSHLGLIAFLLTLEKAHIYKRVDLSAYGEAMDIQYISAHSRYFSITTKTGIVLIDKGSMQVKRWISGVETCDFSWTVDSAASFDDIIFASITISSHAYFQTIDSPSMQLAQWWRIDEYMNQSDIEAKGGAIIIPIQYTHAYVYVRSDKDAIRMFKLRLGRVVIRGKADAVGRFEGWISAVSRMHPEEKVTTRVEIEAVALKNDTVFFGSNYELANKNVSFMYSTSGPSAEFMLSTWTWFSGPDLTISTQLVSASAGASFEVSQMASKVTELGFSSFPSVPSDTKLFFTGSGPMAVITNGSLTFINIEKNEGKIVRNRSVSEGKIVEFCCECVEDIVIVEMNSGERFLMKWESQLESTIATPLLSSCSKLKLIGPALACYSPESILIFSTTLRLCWTITAASLSLPSLHVINILFQYSPFSQQLLLYVACAYNGLFIIGLHTELQAKFLTSFSKSSGVGIALSAGNQLCRVNADGSLTVFDTSEAPNIREIKTLPSWSTGSIIGWAEVSSMLMVHQGQKVMFYDVTQTVHNSLYLIRDIGEGCRVGSWGSWLIEVCTAEEGITVHWLFIEKGKEEALPSLKVQVKAGEGSGDMVPTVGKVKVEAVSSLGERCVSEVDFQLIP